MWTKDANRIRLARERLHQLRLKRLVSIRVCLRCQAAPDRPVHAVTTLQDNFSDLPVLETVSQFLQRPAVTRHEPYRHLEVLG